MWRSLTGLFDAADDFADFCFGGSAFGLAEGDAFCGTFYFWVSRGYGNKDRGPCGHVGQVGDGVEGGGFFLTC